jgi:sialic acid synthase SpsE
MKVIVDLCNQHFGELDELKRMSLNAFLSGASAVKVQLLDSEKLLGTKDKKYRDISYRDAYELAKYCDNLGIEFMATVFDEERFLWLDDLGVETHKIASRTSKKDQALSNLILSDGKPTLISTGMHDFAEFPYGHDDHISYLFCVSKYPTYLDDEKLAKMPHFKPSAYTGYSDHTIGLGAALRAHSRGATVLEKHFSNNLNAQTKLEGGHLGSFDQNSLRQYVNIIRQMEIMEQHSEYQ